MQDQPNCQTALIIGGGLSGLICARLLERNGIDTLVIDRGRRPGGRVGSKWVGPDHGGARLNHGAPRLNLTQASSRAIMASLGFEGEIHAEAIDLPDMSQIPGRLSEGLRICSSTEATRILLEGSQWIVLTQRYGDDSPIEYRADQLVMACPPIQSARLLKDSGLTLPEPLQGTRYTPTWTLLAVVSETVEPFSLPTSKQCRQGVINEIEVSHDHGGGTHLVARMTRDASAQRYDDSNNSVASQMREELLALTKLDHTHVIASTAHRWGLARVSEPVRTSYVHDHSMRLGWCGDAFAGPDGAWADADACVLSASGLADSIAADLRSETHEPSA